MLYLSMLFFLLTLSFSHTGWGTPAKNSPQESPQVTVAAGTTAPEAVFEAHLFRDAQGKTIPYRLLKPRNETLDKYPLVLYLHGTGERGADNKKNLTYIGTVFAAPAMRRQYPAFIAVPQCPEKDNWVAHEGYFGGVPLAAQPAEPLRLTIELVRQLMREYPVDPKRIYLIGISSGGSAIWDLLERSPGQYAAAAPFCGSGDPAKADRLTDIPIWAFHGALDIVVNPNTTRTMITAIQKAGGHPLFTEYPGVYHNCWSGTFRNPAFFAWLFAQKRPG